jgi:hypothetical protein
MANKTAQDCKDEFDARLRDISSRYGTLGYLSAGAIVCGGLSGAGSGSWLGIVGGVGGMLIGAGGAYLAAREAKREAKSAKQEYDNCLKDSQPLP